MKNLFSIGEVSKIKNITVKALRYYHKVGILIPKYIDNDTGYRYYSIDQFIYIDIIKGCRELGTSIKELQEVFKEYNTDRLIEFLKFKRYEAEENIKNMKEIINNIDSISTSVKYAKDIVINTNIGFQFIDNRYVVVAPCKESGNLKELLYYSYLDKLLQDNKVEGVLERGIIYNANLNGDIEPIYVFSKCEKNNNAINTNNITILPEGNYLTLIYNRENEDEQRRKIFQYIKDNNLSIKLYVEIELFNDFFNTSSYNCQIQILI